MGLGYTSTMKTSQISMLLLTCIAAFLSFCNGIYRDEYFVYTST